MGETAKGLLVGNAFHDLPLDERTGSPFAPNTVRVAEQDGHALVRTAQLIDALRCQQAGDFDPYMWWRQILDTAGVFDSPL